MALGEMNCSRDFESILKNQIQFQNLKIQYLELRTQHVGLPVDLIQLYRQLKNWKIG